MSTPTPNDTTVNRNAKYDAWLAAIESGDTIKQACANAGLPWGAVQRWIADERRYGVRDAASRYAHARSVSADFYADRAQEAVEQAVSKDDAPVAKVRSDVYRWRASVANPQRYGDKQDVTHTVNIGTLHLDALRAPRATARIAQPDSAQHVTPLLPDQAGGDVDVVAD